MESCMSEGYTVKETLDCKGLYCPLPIVKMRKAIKGMAEGEVLKVLATDPGSMRDFRSWCDKTGNRLLEAREEDGVFTYVVEKAGGS
jgi:tRNA 2-thiouridine synthesizing protein A